MFAGLFVVVAGVENALLTPDLVSRIAGLGLNRMPVLGIATAILSNLVSNVAAVLVLKPFLAHQADPQRSWAVVAMASTFAANLTVLGSVANLIVVRQAASRGVTIGFWESLRIAAPLTLMTLALGLWWLCLAV